jgi:hypothetical protein
MTVLDLSTISFSESAKTFWAKVFTTDHDGKYTLEQVKLPKTVGAELKKLMKGSAYAPSIEIGNFSCFIIKPATMEARAAKKEAFQAQIAKWDAEKTFKKTTVVMAKTRKASKVTAQQASAAAKVLSTRRKQLALTK